MDVGVRELLGYTAAGLVLATFSAKSIVTLRVLAIASNLFFIAYAASSALMPVLVLHVLLLPLNAIRLRQAMAEGRCIDAAARCRPSACRPVRPAASKVPPSQTPSAPPAEPARVAETAPHAAACAPAVLRCASSGTASARKDRVR